MTRRLLKTVETSPKNCTGLKEFIISGVQQGYVIITWSHRGDGHPKLFWDLNLVVIAMSNVFSK